MSAACKRPPCPLRISTYQANKGIRLQLRSFNTYFGKQGEWKPNPAVWGRPHPVGLIPAEVFCCGAAGRGRAIPLQNCRGEMQLLHKKQRKRSHTGGTGVKRTPSSVVPSWKHTIKVWNLNKIRSFHNGTEASRETHPASLCETPTYGKRLRTAPRVLQQDVCDVFISTEEGNLLWAHQRPNNPEATWRRRTHHLQRKLVRTCPANKNRLKRCTVRDYFELRMNTHEELLQQTFPWVFELCVGHNSFTYFHSCWQ